MEAWASLASRTGGWYVVYGLKCPSRRPLSGGRCHYRGVKANIKSIHRGRGDRRPQKRIVASPCSDIQTNPHAAHHVAAARIAMRRPHRSWATSISMPHLTHQCWKVLTHQCCWVQALVLLAPHPQMLFMVN